MSYNGYQLCKELKQITASIIEQAMGQHAVNGPPD